MLFLQGSARDFTRVPLVDMHIETDGFNAGEAHSRFLRKGGLKEILPSLASWELAGGLKAAVDIKGGTQDWETRGRIQLEKGSLRSLSGLAIDATSVELDMPFQLASRTPAQPDATASHKVSHLEYGSISVGPFLFPKNGFSFILAHNDFLHHGARDGRCHHEVDAARGHHDALGPHDDNRLRLDDLAEARADDHGTIDGTVDVPEADLVVAVAAAGERRRRCDLEGDEEGGKNRGTTQRHEKGAPGELTQEYSSRVDPAR